MTQNGWREHLHSIPKSDQRGGNVWWNSRLVKVLRGKFNESFMLMKIERIFPSKIILFRVSTHNPASFLALFPLPLSSVFIANMHQVNVHICCCWWFFIQLIIKFTIIINDFLQHFFILVPCPQRMLSQRLDLWAIYFCHSSLLLYLYIFVGDVFHHKVYINDNSMDVPLPLRKCFCLLCGLWMWMRRTHIGWILTFSWIL